MKKKTLYLYYITLFIICQLAGAFVGVFSGNTPVMAKDVNNFYFESFDADYYLGRDENGVSRLKVVENVTAVFPDYEQNKGICRQIAYTNQDNANVTLPNLSRNNLTLKRNGESEPIYSIEKGDKYYDVCTGDETYVTGKQVYTFEYEFEKVVTEFDGYQELYWDTNGNGARQRFNKVAARVHFAEPEVYDGQNWCYVGRYGEKGEGRCKVQEIKDGLEFSAVSLAAYENLTFDVLLKPGSFVVPAPESNYILVVVLVVVAVLCGLILIVPVKKFLAAGEKRRYYKGLFVKPEYQPHASYNVAEMAAVYMGHKESDKVAVLLDMIVKKKIAIYQTGESKFGKKKWGIEVLLKGEMRPEEIKLVRILKGGKDIEDGEKFEVKKHTATTELVSLGRGFESAITTETKKDGLGEKGFEAPGKVSSVGGSAITSIIVAVIFIVMARVLFGGEFSEAIGEIISEMFGGATGVLVGKNWIPIVIVAVIIGIMVTTTVLRTMTRKYEVRTKKGLEMSRYMEGLKLYIEMAEAERMKLLQSVEGADTSATGVVRLYEKLLPYAAVFGLEESWMKELEKYYKMTEVTEPDWYRSGITPMDVIVMSHLMSGYSQTATTMASSGGSSSSGFSGSFGGGFSGGGGGGGGFSGR